jgi:hypothetical protein
VLEGTTLSVRGISHVGRKLLLPLLLLILLCCPACARNGRKPVYPVRGQVLVAGKPASRAMVTFHPVGESGPDAVHPVGHVDDEGYFTLTSYVTGDGAPEGDYQVAVVWYLATRTRNPSEGDDYQTHNYLPERYGRAETSQLTARVAKGPNELAPFQLKQR